RWAWGSRRRNGCGRGVAYGGVACGSPGVTGAWYRGGARGVHGLFADAEGGEDAAEDIVGGNGAGDLAEEVEGKAEFGGEEVGVGLQRKTARTVRSIVGKGRNDPGVIREDIENEVSIEQGVGPGGHHFFTEFVGGGFFAGDVDEADVAGGRVQRGGEHVSRG